MILKSLAITNKGFEDICSKEIKELIGKTCKLGNGFVTFSCSHDELCKIAYKAQSVNRVLVMFGEFKEIKDIDNITLGKSFAVRCVKAEEDDSLELERAVGEIIFKKTKVKVDLKKPETLVLVFVLDGKYYVGYDFVQMDLSKRSYKIFLAPKSPRGTMAYCLIRSAGYSGSEFILDPFATNGVITIEAACYATGKSVRFYDKDKLKIEYDFEQLDGEKKASGIYAFDGLLSNVERVKKNAKIAGVEKSLKVSKVETEWLDTKLEEKTVDIICTMIPEISKRSKEKLVRKTYTEFFYQAEFVLKDDGKIVCMLHNPEALIEYATKGKFKLVSSREVYSGQDKLVVLTFEKVLIVEKKSKK